MVRECGCWAENDKIVSPLCEEKWKKHSIKHISSVSADFHQSRVNLFIFHNTYVEYALPIWDNEVPKVQ